MDTATEKAGQATEAVTKTVCHASRIHFSMWHSDLELPEQELPGNHTVGGLVGESRSFLGKALESASKYVQSAQGTL